jgi:ABC-2 type transport system ATP-binding protein
MFINWLSVIAKRDVNAVNNISFRVSPGEVFGLLGPNGAGKSTTLGILTTRVVATSGVVTVSGIDLSADPVRVRSQIAVVLQRMNLARALTVRQICCSNGSSVRVRR